LKIYLALIFDWIFSAGWFGREEGDSKKEKWRPKQLNLSVATWRQYFPFIVSLCFKARRFHSLWSSSYNYYFCLKPNPFHSHWSTPHACEMYWMTHSLCYVVLSRSLEVFLLYCHYPFLLYCWICCQVAGIMEFVKKSHYIFLYYSLSVEKMPWLSRYLCPSYLMYFENGKR